MKISTKGRYGLRIMMDIAMHDGEAPRMISQICKAQDLSLKYVSRLIIALRKAGMIYSIRGAGGGYKLRRKPMHITMLEIIEAMEGPVSIVDCVACPKKCKKSPNCAARQTWCGINNRIRSVFEHITLQDIINGSGCVDDYSI